MIIDGILVSTGEVSRVGQTLGVQATLVQQLAEASHRVSSASMELDTTMNNHGELPNPAGTTHIRNASNVLRAAREEVIRAHGRLADFLEHGVVPEDLR